MNNLKTSSDPSSFRDRHPGHYWNHCCGLERRGFDSRIFIGILLVAAGFVLIAQNLNLLPYDISHILISWPMLLIAFGLFNLARRSYTPAFIFLLIGLFFLTPKIMEVPDHFYQNFWPVVLVIVGIMIIFRKRHHWHQKWQSGKISSDSIDESAIFGGKDISIVNDNFTGGKISAIFGGSKINLLYSKPAPGCTIDVETIFGGIKLIVPEDWNIKVEVVPTFGGFEDKRSPSAISRSDPNKTVVIKGTCIFGGGEITSIP